MLDDLAWPKGSGGISTLREGYGGLRNGKMAGLQEQRTASKRLKDFLTKDESGEDKQRENSSKAALGVGRRFARGGS